MQKFVTETVDEVEDLLYPEGPIIMLQVSDRGLDICFAWSSSCAHTTFRSRMNTVNLMIISLGRSLWPVISPPRFRCLSV